MTCDVVNSCPSYGQAQKMTVLIVSGYVNKTKIGLWCLTPISTLLQLSRGCQL